jgi:hypothetical protein
MPNDRSGPGGRDIQLHRIHTSGNSVTIDVTQKDDQGNVTWKVTGKG